MAEPVKYTFDQAFDGGAKNRYDEDVANLRTELDVVRQSSFSEGIADGRKQVQDEIEAATLETLNSIAASAQELMTHQHDLEARLKQEMVQLSYAIASKLAPSLIRQQPLTEIEGLIEECLSMALKEPRIVIRVSPDLLDGISKKIETLKKASTFSGDIILIDDASLSFQDCRVEWPDGGLERKFMDIQLQVQDAVQRFVMAQFDTSPDWSTQTLGETMMPITNDDAMSAPIDTDTSQE
jgi:flagellar assembly protein FliH